MALIICFLLCMGSISTYTLVRLTIVRPCEVEKQPKASFTPYNFCLQLSHAIRLELELYIVN